jgi:hypothetical protein
MADIPVNFTTNAAAVSADVKQLTNSARQAQQQAAAAAKEVALAGKGATAEMRQRLILLKQIAAEQTKMAAEAKAGNQASLGRATKASAALGTGRAFGAAGALLGAGAGVGAMAAATVAFTGVGFVIGLLTEKIGEWMEHSAKQAEKLAEFSKTLEEAISNRNKSGIDLANSQGPQISAAIATGRLDKAKELSGKFGLADSLDATQKAAKFGEFSDKVLLAAGAAARLTGGTLSSGVDAAKGMNLDASISELSRAIASLGGVSMSPEAFDASLHKYNDSSQVSNINKIRGSSFGMETTALGNIDSRSVQQAADGLALSLNAVTDAAKATSKQFNDIAAEQQKKADAAARYKEQMAEGHFMNY